MTDDQTTCPHCGAEKSPEWKQLRFHCGTIVCDGESFRSSQCELKTLRAKVAAQQAIIDDIRNNLYVQTFDTCPPGYAGIINEGMLRRLGVKLGDA